MPSPAPRQHHRSASSYEESIGFARAIRAGDRILVSGTAPIGPDGETVEGDDYFQAKRCF
jgi:enamine deaminase RidA (YjgF/YER057c/UK114 family)